ncbi:MICOS complex subunit MIC25 [Bienertia sinuspersici]
MPVPSSSNPELEAIRSVLKKSESVLEKLQKHEENMLKEVTQKSKELHEKEFRVPQQKSAVCQSEKDACVTCYKENIKDSLKCASFVQSYHDCVRKARNLGKVLE